MKEPKVLAELVTNRSGVHRNISKISIIWRHFSLAQLPGYGIIVMCVY